MRSKFHIRRDDEKLENPRKVNLVLSRAAILAKSID
jgi:hypothetical protein